MNIINKELLSKYIDKTELSYSELAGIIDISRNTIHNLVGGFTKPSLPIINCLASSLDFTQEDFIAIFFPNVHFKQ